ncbi:PREDICTED: probable phospholipid-transporting ATPase IF [Poecilia mexicana]|uniref:probable phospholipid-transporting ATPase IF n=1 Tax=Poecilia formosa TaxID=48698 RepID=UPI000443BF26|nr:PREDICTED: probable phospholipid-transporting ATPase IF [Poecilia formosa]XP_014855546.1 PREDICTED: probable phospholipid-transporting ATPase IF [Poecilia mexicana]XP_014855547.1 PREDICTED: probable phospholipid-transporting ATPase IF [Poecilia mexicana]
MLPVFHTPVLALPALTVSALLQSLSTPQAQALSCVESLCCYQHGQSGCSRLARLLEQMTGQCKASVNNCHTSSRSNRSWSDTENFYSNDRTILTLSPIEASRC